MSDLLLIDLALLEPAEDGDENELLEGAARAILPLIPDYDPNDEKPLIWQLTEGALKKKFDELLHPRWPKGAKRSGKSIAGEFMHKGDVFDDAEGRKWQVINAVKGRIEAVDASGDPKKVEHRVFKATKGAVSGVGVGIKGVKPATLSQSMGKKSPIVRPYVDPSTHDPKIKLPKDSKLTAEQWKRFGKEDQDYYVELMERFGKWDPAVGKSMKNKLASEYDHAVVSIVDSQVAHSTSVYHTEQPTVMNLANHMASHGFEGKTGYQNVKNVFDEITEAIHWDLYNRTKSPDLLLMHGGERAPEKVKAAHIDGDTPIFTGFSQSYGYSAAANWGSTILATPTAIRYIGLSHFQGGSNHPGEQEMALNVRAALDDRSIVFNTVNMGVQGTAAALALRNYIQGETGEGGYGTANQPASGKVVEEIKKVWEGKGEIPIPEEPPGLAPVGGSGTAQFQHLDGDVEKKAGLMAHKLKYKSESGSKEGAQGELVGMGLKPGDFIEGQQGTRYIIVADAGDTSGAGLRYVKVEKNGTVNYQKSWQFSASAGNNFFRLDGHLDFPKQKKEKGFVPFSKAQYDELAAGEKKPMVKFAKDEMLKVDGEGYKVIGPFGDGSKVKVESLDTGKQFAINGGYKGVQLVPTKDFTPPVAEPDYKPFVGQQLIWTMPGGSAAIVTYQGTGDGKNHLVKLPDGENGALPLEDMMPLDGFVGVPSPKAAEEGDTFAHDGKKYTVTTVLKSGIVKAKPTDGHVEKFAGPGKQSAVMPVIPELFRPTDYALGDKAKAKEFSIGDLVSSSDKKMHPHRVVGIGEGKMVVFRNLETGAIVTTTKQKSWTRIVMPEPEIDAETDPKTHTPKPETTLPKGTLEEKIDTLNLEPGDQFVIPGGAGTTYEAVTPGGADVKAVAPDGTYGPTIAWVGSLDMPSVTLVKPKEPSGPSSFSMDKYQTGDSKKLGDLNEGDLFLTATGLPAMLKSKKPKGGATAVAMHNGKLIKNISYDKQVTTLTEKESLPEIPYEELKPGDTVMLGKLKAGDQWKGMEAMPGALGVQVVDTDIAAPDQHIKIASILDDGTLGDPFATSVSNDAPVIYLGKAKPPVKVTPIEPMDLKSAAVDGGFEGYLHHKSGTAKHFKVGQIAVGTVFVDKAGGKWKKKQGGSLPVIADESGDLYSVDPGAWVKPSDQVPGGIAFIDKSPDPATPDEFKGLTDNATNQSLAELGAAAGDKFTYMGKSYVVTKAPGGPGPYQGQSVTTGSTKIFAGGSVPAAFGKGAPTSGGTLTPYTAALLEPGDTFYFGDKLDWAGEGWTVSDVKSGVIKATHPNGDSWMGSATALGNVYGVKKAEPDGTEKVKGSDLKPGDAFVHISIVTGKPTFDHVYYVTGNTDAKTGNPEILGEPGGGGFIGGDDTGQLPPDSEVVKVPTPDWAPPPIHQITKSPPPSKPIPLDAPTSAKGQDQITIQHHLEAKKPAAEFTDFEQALTPQGKWVYKATNGQFFVVGTKEQYKPSKESVKLTPVIPQVGSNVVLVSGEGTTVGEVESGEFFAFKGDDYVVLAKSDAGSTALRIHDNSVFFNPSDKPSIWGGPVTKREPTAATIANLPEDAYFEAHGAIWHKTGQDEAILVKKTKPQQMAAVGFVQHNWGAEAVKPVAPPAGVEATDVDAPGAVAPPPETPEIKTLKDFGHIAGGQDVFFAGHLFKVTNTTADNVTIVQQDKPGSLPVTVNFEYPAGTAKIEPSDFSKLPSWEPSEHGGLTHPEPGDKIFYLDYSDYSVKTGTVQGYHQSSGTPSIWTLDLEGGVTIEHDDVVGFAPGGSTLLPGSQAMDEVLGSETAVSQLQIGDTFHAGGYQHTVLTKTKAGVYTKRDDGYGDFFGNHQTVTDVNLGPLAKASPSVLEPYLHPKSGSNKYDKIGTLTPGTKFSDKKHGTYTVVGHFGDQTVYEDEMGQQFVTKGTDRVLVTKAPLIEMRSRLTTAGSFKVYV